jgi:hypothetical protein
VGALLICGWLLVSGSAWLGWSAERAARVQRAEGSVRRAIGRWLSINTRPTDLIAAEPIGYIGYYSGRRILDEVGLVSPEMVPLNRAGSGWFGKMLARFRPDYVVERPYYLAANETINSRVPMFAGPADRGAFEQEYAPVARFGSDEVPAVLHRDYQFVVFARRPLKSGAARSASP